MFIRVNDEGEVLAVTTEDSIDDMIEVEFVPVEEHIDGKVCIQKYDFETGKVYNFYIDETPKPPIQIQPTVEEQLEQIRQDNLTLMKALADIYELLP